MLDKKRKAFGLLLAAVMLMSLFTATALAAPITFIDVSPNAWYYQDVQKAVDTGLIKGYPDNSFGPDKNLTYAEAVKLAAVMHKLASTGSNEFDTGDPWYQPYVDYAEDKGIISRDYDWNQPATRAGYMGIFANAIPDKPALSSISPLTEINQIPDGSIPDVPMTHPQAAAIYKLYRAGIVIGSDEKHSCMPNSNIRRCEVAAILTRMMNAEERIALSLGQTPEPTAEKPDKPLVITTQPLSLTVKKGENAMFSVSVDGGKAPYTFVWYARSADSASFARCDDDILWSERYAIQSDGGKSILTVKKADVFAKQNGAGYYCVIADADGKSVTSETAVLTVSAAPDTPAEPLKVVAQPESISVERGKNAAFHVTVSGGKAPYTFQWYYCNADMTDFYRCEAAAEWYVRYGIETDGGSSTLTVLEADEYMRQNGSMYYCVVTDADGKSVASDAAALTVTAAPLMCTAQPRNVMVLKGKDASFSVSVSGGNGPYTFRWYYCNADMSDFYPCESAAEWYVRYSIETNGDTSTLTVLEANENMLQDGAMYYCFVTDADGRSVTSQTARLTIRTSSPGTR